MGIGRTGDAQIFSIQQHCSETQINWLGTSDITIITTTVPSELDTRTTESKESVHTIKFKLFSRVFHLYILKSIRHAYIATEATMNKLL